MSDVDKYIKLFEQMQMSLDKAESAIEKERVRKNFERATQNFDQSDIAKAYRKMDEQAESLMVPPERSQYAVGKFVKALKKVDDLIESKLDKMQGIDENTPGATATNRGAVVGKDRTKAFGNSKKATGALYGATATGAASVGVTSILGALAENEDALMSYVEANNDLPESKKEATAFEKAFSKAWKANKDTFEFQGKTYSTELKRDEKSEGSLLSDRSGYGKGGAVLDLVNAILGKQTKTAKKTMVSQEKASQELSKMLDDNPMLLDDLSDEDYEAVVSKLPQKQSAKLGMGDEPLDDMVEMARGMEPAEVAKNLEMFNDMDEIFEYTNSLDAKDARQFMQNLSDEDFEIFGAELPDVGSKLGPREVKAEGSLAIVVPAGYSEMPVDTYDNISPKEKKKQEKEMLSDSDMEDDYVDYVAEEVLSKDEQDYLFKALDKDERLEEILDKVILNSSEFAGSGEVEGPGTGVSDSIPARLSDGEFVFTKKAVDQIGADKLQQMMDDAEREFDQRKGKALGGMASDNLYNQPEVNLMGSYTLPKQADAQQTEDIGRQMMYASKVPSLLNQ